MRTRFAETGLSKSQKGRPTMAKDPRMRVNMIGVLVYVILGIVLIVFAVGLLLTLGNTF